MSFQFLNSVFWALIIIYISPTLLNAYLRENVDETEIIPKIYRIKYVILDEPTSTLDDVKNIIIEFEISLETFYSPIDLLLLTKSKCNENDEFAKFWTQGLFHNSHCIYF